MGSARSERKKRLLVAATVAASFVPVVTVLFMTTSNEGLYTFHGSVGGVGMFRCRHKNFVNDTYSMIDEATVSFLHDHDKSAGWLYGIRAAVYIGMGAVVTATAVAVSYMSHWVPAKETEARRRVALLLHDIVAIISLLTAYTMVHVFWHDLTNKAPPAVCMPCLTIATPSTVVVSSAVLWLLVAIGHWHLESATAAVPAPWRPHAYKALAP
ncbi:hypothetical protein DIPPA_65908 [Diplonema papillatum]|nr:hypothetical protein DIPPA_65908 [Diplonema papillatum]